jgi:hypothetical protein
MTGHMTGHMTSQSAGRPHPQARRQATQANLGRLFGAASLLLFAASPVRAEGSNFGDFTLDAKAPIAVVNGSTGGSTSLPAVVANTDRRGNRCLGFADPKPDHVMQLPKALGKLSFQVDSGSASTLVIVGPDGTVRCSTGGNKKDAQMEETNWQAGSYQVWVGSMTPGKKRNYRLVVQSQ